jgi:hypothetical protein
VRYGTVSAPLIGILLQWLSSAQIYLGGFIMSATAVPETQILANQKTILENQALILKNQEEIKKNQLTLSVIVKNQEKILAAVHH